VQTTELERYILDYVAREPVERIIVGQPRQMNGQDSENMVRIQPFVNRLRKLLPQIPVELFDERFTSVLAHRAMIESGIEFEPIVSCPVEDILRALGEWFMAHNPEIESFSLVSQTCH